MKIRTSIFEQQFNYSFKIGINNINFINISTCKQFFKLTSTRYN